MFGINTIALLIDYCNKCGCKLKDQEFEFGFILTDGKRDIKVHRKENIITAATEFAKIHRLEKKFASERDPRKRRKIISKLYSQNSSSGRAVG